MAKKPADDQGKVTAAIFKGMPHVELTEEDRLRVKLELNPNLTKEIAEAVKNKRAISISLDSLTIDMRTNQSVGMMDASTGCISNPGGPSC